LGALAGAARVVAAAPPGAASAPAVAAAFALLDALLAGAYTRSHFSST